MTSVKISLGRWGEEQAADFLTRTGYTVLARNVRTPYGEMDLIAQAADPDRTLVFVEVKTRRSTAFGLPEAAVTRAKQTHLLTTAQAILQAHPEWDGPWRVDVIAIRVGRDGSQPEIVHFENAIC